MSTAIVKLDNKAELAIILGDLSRLTAEERMQYINSICQSLGMNPLTGPFGYITFQGKLVLYAKKDAAEQLRKIYGVAITDMKVEVVEGICVVRVTAVDREGRTDHATGMVPVENLKGVDKANAMMKAETKAKRRVTLSICGLGILDESEIEEEDVTPPQGKPAALAPVDDAHAKKIAEIVAKFRKVGVSANMICDKYKIDDAGLLTPEQLDELRQIGTALVNKKTTAQEAFGLKEGAG